MSNLHHLAARAVPRYTSYPTAPHFSPAVDATVYAGWLAALAQAATLSLYIHVPFCAQMCLYCGCHTKVVRRRDPVEAYAERLLAEISLVAAQAGGRRVVHLHWGGGTPSMLGCARLSEIATHLARLFDLSALHEHAIELDPRHVTPELADTLAAIGVSRASLGVQDFSDGVQEAIGRVQPFTLVARAADTLRRAGIQAINLDLMYGLPRQTEEDVRQTAKLAHDLGPQRLALFGYAHVPWMKTHQRLIDEAALPDTGLRLAQAEVARETLEACGYQAIGLDHFAQPDDDLAAAARGRRLRRNFQGYTTDQADALIGIGASAIGRTLRGYVQNAADLAGYGRAIAAGRLATAKGLALSADDQLRGDIIERLMCDFEIDLRCVADDPHDRFGDELAALAELEAAGLLVRRGSHIAMTEPGRPFVRLAAAAFDAYLAGGPARHSVAV